ncbi:MAG TPA: TetR/AcrR family transcriptional regulator [Solirubrobacteraceae bacterium]
MARGQVAEIQRVRILTAMIAVAGESGWPNVSVANVVARSGASRRTFYELFDDCEACYLAAFDEACKRLEGVLGPAYGGGGKWFERVRNALAALLGLFEEEPLLARFLVVDSLGAGPQVLERRRERVSDVTLLVDEQARGGGTSAEVSGLAAEGIAGAVLAVIHDRLVDPGTAPLSDLLNPLMGVIVLPYMGRAAVRRELERQPPAPHDAAVPLLAGEVLHGLGTRLTYRTVRVLLSVAGAPGSSNREVGLAAGMTDQGQISKLLRRLEGLGLIRNECDAPAQGAANAWLLTERGAQAERAMSANIG